MDKSAPPTILVVLFPFFFVGLWCAVSLVLSTMGGWRRLAESFPARGQPSGRRFFMQGGKVGLIYKIDGQCDEARFSGQRDGPFEIWIAFYQSRVVFCIIMKALRLIALLLLLLAGCNNKRTRPATTLTDEQAKSLARDLANQKAKVLYGCEPFWNGPSARFVQGRWVWRDRRARGTVDIEATVDFAADGSARSVDVILLDSRAMLFEIRPP